MTGQRRTRSVGIATRLGQAFLELMAEKGYERTTIKDVLDRARVPRTTFYAHFPNKAALLDSQLAALQGFLRSQVAQNPRRAPLAFARPMLEHAEEQRDLFRSLVSRRGGALVLRRLQGTLEEVALDELRPLAKQLNVPAQALAEHVVGAFFSLLSYWLTHRWQVTAAELDCIYRELTLPGLERVRRR